MKLKVGTSVNFKDGRSGIVEDYDERYWFIRDSNSNVTKIKRTNPSTARSAIEGDKSFRDSNEDYDYKTGEVNGDDIFDTTTTGMTGSWEDLLKGKDLDYYKNKKNLKGKIVQMSPNEYYSECVKMFRNNHGSNTTVEKLKQGRKIDNGKNYLEYLKNIILEKKKKFPICVLDLSYNPGQEGLHRMMIAGELFGWDTKFPVLLVETYDKVRQARIEKDSVQKEFNMFMEKLVDTFKRWSFSDLEDFCEILSEKIFDEYKETPILSTQGDNLDIEIYSDETDDSLIYNINLNEFNIGSDSDTNEELEEIDVSEYDDLSQEELDEIDEFLEDFDEE